MRPPQILRLFALAVAVGTVSLALSLAGEYAVERSIHGNWQPDAMGRRIATFVRYRHQYAQNPFVVDTLAHRKRLLDCYAQLASLSLTESTWWTTVSPTDSVTLAAEPCAFRPQERPEFAFAIAQKLADIWPFALATVFAVLALGVALAYSHRGWGRLAISASVLRGSILLARLWFRYEWGGYAATAASLSVVAGVSISILGARELVRWIARGFSEQNT